MAKTIDQEAAKTNALSLGVRGIKLQSVEDVKTCAQLAMNAGIVPDGLKDSLAKVCTVLLAGAEAGLGPMQALRGIYIVNGRPTLHSDAGMALIQASGVQEWRKEWCEGTEKDGDLCAFVHSKRRGQSEPYIGCFDMEDAKRAGKLGKGTYGSWLRDMLMWRARWRVDRVAYPDVLAGLTYADVAPDYPAPQAAPREVKLEELASTGTDGPTMSDVYAQAEKAKVVASGPAVAVETIDTTTGEVMPAAATEPTDPADEPGKDFKF